MITGALFFDVSDESLLPTLSVSGADVTDFRALANGVSDLGQGANVNGSVVNEFGRFDVGVEFGTAGVAQNDVRTTSFILSSSAAFLTLDFLQLQDFAVRITSVGVDGGLRTDSLKLAGQATAAPDALDDAFTVSEDDALVGANVLANDSDADVGDTLFVYAVNGSAANVGAAVSVISAGGRAGLVTITAAGAVLFNPGANFQDLAAGETDTVTVAYTVSDGNGGFDTATITLTVTGAADSGPTIIGNSGVGSLAIGPGVALVGDTLLGGGVIAGSTLASQNVIVGNLAGSSGSAVLSGAGAVLTVTPGNLSIGLAGAGAMLVENGATVLVDSGNLNPAIPGDTLDIVVGGSATGVGSLTVRGAGSRVETRGISNLVQIGLNGGHGDVLVEAGGTLDTQRIRIGIGAGSDGEMTITGAGSALLVTSEHGTQPIPFNNFAGSATIGFGGTGTLNVLDGATAQVREGSRTTRVTVQPSSFSALAPAAWAPC